jgi:hypothetical protein
MRHDVDALCIRPRGKVHQKSVMLATLAWMVASSAL